MSLPHVMVTGGAGFIGSHLIERLLRDSVVHVLDAIPLENAATLSGVKDHPNLHYTVGDIRRPRDLEAFWVADSEVIYHLASVVGIKKYMADPLSLIDISVIGTRHLIECALRHGTRILFTSTSEIYGNNPDVPWDEDGDRVLGSTSVDRWCYSSAKAVCEHMLFGAGRAFGLPFSIVRFFNVYGPRQNPYFVVSQSIYKALRGESPLLYDDGSMTRCFTYVGDVVEGLLAAARDEQGKGEVFNLGNPVETSIRELIEIIIEEAGTGVTFETFDTRAEFGRAYQDIIRRVPKVTKAEELLGWKAATSLREGLRQTIEWAKENPWWLEEGRNQIDFEPQKPRNT